MFVPIAISEHSTAISSTRITVWPHRWGRHRRIIRILRQNTYLAPCGAFPRQGSHSGHFSLFSGQGSRLSACATFSGEGLHLEHFTGLLRHASHLNALRKFPRQGSHSQYMRFLAILSTVLRKVTNPMVVPNAISIVFYRFLRYFAF